MKGMKGNLYYPRLILKETHDLVIVLLTLIQFNFRIQLTTVPKTLKVTASKTHIAKQVIKQLDLYLCLYTKVCLNYPA